METAKLKKFAQHARRSLMEQVSAKLKRVLAEDSAARRENTEVAKKRNQQIKVNDKNGSSKRLSTSGKGKRIQI